MRLIFLDVDGVLNQLQKYFVDNKCVQRLSSLIDFDVKIVLISSWRLGLDIDYKKCSPQVQKLRDICNQYDFDIKYKTGKTGDRRTEVLDFLSGKNVYNYIILDDDESEYSSVSDLNFYRVNNKTGLTDLDIAKIKSKW